MSIWIYRAGETEKKGECIRHGLSIQCLSEQTEQLCFDKNALCSALTAFPHLFAVWLIWVKNSEENIMLTNCYGVE